MHDTTAVAGRPSLGVAMLAWRCPETVRNTLGALQRLPRELFHDRVLFFQEIDDADRAVAQTFGFRAEGNAKNQGIREGIKQAVRRCNSDLVLFLECDCLLIESAESAVAQIAAASAAIAYGDAKVVRMRHIRQPGTDYGGTEKFARYWPVGDSLGDSLKTRLRRLARPGKARRLIGQAIMACDNAEARFPRWIQRPQPSLYRVNSHVIPWTNQAILVDRRWMLDVLIPFAETHPTSRSVNGFPDLEKELNCAWWRQQEFGVGQSIPGLFSHYRLDRPAGDEKTLLHGEVETPSRAA